MLGDAEVRALTSHRCGPVSIPGPGVTCGLSLLFVLVLPPSTKTNTPNSNRSGNESYRFVSFQVSPSLNRFIIVIIIIIIIVIIIITSNSYH